MTILDAQVSSLSRHVDAFDDSIKLVNELLQSSSDLELLHMDQVRSSF
jgi:hypothetical protein